MNELNFNKIKQAAQHAATSKYSRLSDNSTVTSFLEWVEQKKKQIQCQLYPSELTEIEKEILINSEDLNEMEQFRGEYLKQFENFRSFSNRNDCEELKYDLNELEISYNLLYVRHFKLKLATYQAILIITFLEKIEFNKSENKMLASIKGLCQIGE